MLTFYVFMQELTAQIRYLRAVNTWLGQMIQVRIGVHCAFGLALVFYLSIQRVGDMGALE